MKIVLSKVLPDPVPPLLIITFCPESYASLIFSKHSPCSIFIFFTLLENQCNRLAFKSADFLCLHRLPMHPVRYHLRRLNTPEVLCLSADQQARIGPDY